MAIDRKAQAEARALQWFPKTDSVALGILGYIIEGETRKPFTLEDCIYQLGCNASTAVGSLYHLRKMGYIASRKDSDRIVHTKNPKWGRNVLRSTSRGRTRFAQYEEEQRKAAEYERENKT